jgi:hypothetical protein
MKTISKMKKGGKGIPLHLLIFLLVLGLLYTFAVAQSLTPKLTESEIRSVIPILKIEIAGYDQLEKAVKMERDARLALINGIKSGKIDPLNWLEQHSKYVMVPPGAIYEPACSRAVSIAGWEGIMEQQPTEEDIANITTPPVRPKAIFTFGKEIPAINKNALIKRSKNIDISGESMFDVNNPSYQEMRSILENTRSFYSKRDFSANYSISGDAVIFYPTYAEGEISGVVLEMYYDAFDPNFTDVRKNCMSLPVGPTVEIEAGDKLMEKVFKPGKTQVGMDDDNIKRNLQKAGITEERYAEIKAALIAARANSESPEEQELTALDFTPMTSEEKQAAREYEKAVQIMKEEIRAKKNNIQLYTKYKADLYPILDILQKYMGGQ